MNTAKRYTFGLLSTLLFAVGLGRAAERFDPVTYQATSVTKIAQPAEDCVFSCNLAEDGGIFSCNIAEDGK